MGADVSGIDESAKGLADVLHVKRRVEEMLRAILESDPDEWNLQIGGEEPGPIYVQGVQEDDGCIHIELVHESVAARPLGNQEREFLEQAGWQPPDHDIPNYWMFLEADEWTPSTTAPFLAESIDRVYHAFDPRVTDGTVSVMPMDLASEVMGDDEPIVAIRMPGDDEEWEPVWRSGELGEEVPVETSGPEVTRVRIAFPAPPKGMLLRDAPSMPSPTPLWVVIDDDFGPTNLVFTTQTDTWTRRGGRWVPWDIDDESDDPRDRMEDTFQVYVDPPFIDLWDRESVTTEMAELYGYTFSIESTHEGEFYVYTGPAVDYAARDKGLDTALPAAEPVVPAATPQTPMPTAGWYPDPWRAAHLRWWDGTQWTGSTR